MDERLFYHLLREIDSRSTRLTTEQISRIIGSSRHINPLCSHGGIGCGTCPISCGSNRDYKKTKYEDGSCGGSGSWLEFCNLIKNHTFTIRERYTGPPPKGFFEFNRDIMHDRYNLIFDHTVFQFWVQIFLFIKEGDQQDPLCRDLIEFFKRRKHLIRRFITNFTNGPTLYSKEPNDISYYTTKNVYIDWGRPYIGNLLKYYGEYINAT